MAAAAYPDTTLIVGGHLDFSMDMDLIASVVKVATGEDEEAEISAKEDARRYAERLRTGHSKLGEGDRVVEGPSPQALPDSLDLNRSASPTPTTSEHSTHSPKHTDITEEEEDDEDDDGHAMTPDDKNTKEVEDKSYFKELFPQLDFDKQGWMRRWPTFDSRNTSWLHPEVEVDHTRATNQYLFNLKFYEFDAKVGNFVNRDLRYQDFLQRKCETDSSLFDQKMYMDYYGKTWGRRHGAGRGYGPEPARPQLHSRTSTPPAFSGFQECQGFNKGSKSHFHQPDHLNRDQDRVDLQHLQHAVDMYLGNSTSFPNGGNMTKRDAPVGPDPKRPDPKRQMFKPLPPSPLPRFNNN